jgi:hypothetical protein
MFIFGAEEDMFVLKIAWRAPLLAKISAFSAKFELEI